MTRAMFAVMLGMEARLRLRRNSTYVAMLAVMVAVWFMIADPSKGVSMLVANHARVLYDSTGLAFGSSVIATILIGLFGFYLVRGRVDEDLRIGMGNVLASTPVHNAGLIIGRWAGGVAYLSSLIVVLALTMIVLQAVRGEGSIEPLVFLQFYLLTILPQIMFVVGMAILFDSHKRLMGKLGDVIFFFIWLFQVAMTGLIVESGNSVLLLMFDPAGMGVLLQRGQMLLSTNGMAVGMNGFDKALAPVVMNSNFWTWPMILTRFCAGALAIIPLALAVRMFHRFSPDKVSALRTGKGWSIGGLVNRIFGPVEVFSRLLFAVASRLPRLPAQIGAELALTFAANPLTGPLLVLTVVAGVMLEDAALPGLLLGAVLYWGVVIADLSVRDFKSDTEQLGTAVNGGATQRYWRQSITTMLLGFMLTAPVLVRWLESDYVRALALVSGIVALTGLAQLLGRTTRTARAFVVLFLFGMYIASQATDVAVLDIVGAHASATVGSAVNQLVVGLLLLAAGFAFERRRA
jgi:hypothetical protein